MKKHLFYLTLFLLLFFPSFVKAADNTLTCKVLHKLDGSIVYYDSNGNHTTAEGLLADSNCNSTCKIRDDVDESWGSMFAQTSEFADIPYCINSNYAMRGCFTGAINYAYAAFDSSAWISNNPDFPKALVEYAKTHPDLVESYRDVVENRNVMFIQDINYRGEEPAFYETTHDIAKATSSIVCNQLLSRSYLNSEGEIELIYGSIMSHVATALNASMTGISGTISSVNRTLDSGRAVIVSISTFGGSCNALFTINTHYITIVKRNAQGQYLVLHSGGLAQVQKSGWYDEATIRQVLGCVNAGVWSFMPNDCFDHIYEVNSVCSCDTTTGYYTYNKTNADGSITPVTWQSGTPTPSGIDINQCPGTCNKACHNPKPNEYYCADGNSCTKEEYTDQCLHICENPYESGDGNYYCQNGQKCSEAQYNVECKGETNCLPTVSMPSDCDEILSESVKYEDHYEGLISDINQIGTSCNSDVNQVKSCVLGKNDLTNESFNATEYELNDDNPYCNIWCNETYEFTLPTARYTTSGGYFTLSTSIKGTRDCYVSSADDSQKPIDHEKFQHDLEEAQHAVIDAWNEYNHWREGTDPSHEWTTTETDSNNGCISSHQECSTSCDSMGNCHESCHTVCDERCDAEDSWTVVHHEWDYTAYNYNGGTYTAHQSEITDGGGSCYNCGCSGRDGNSQIPLFRQRAASAKNTLIDKINDLNRVIARYNSCTGNISNSSNSNLVNSTVKSNGWVNDMVFAPRVEFSYNEDYQSKMNGEFAETSSSESSSNMFCTGDIDEQYKCISETNTSNMNAVIDNNYQVLTCDDDSCSFKSFKVSQATWIRKTKKHEADYESDKSVSTHTQYGTIKIDSGSSLGLFTKLPDGSIPVSLSTETGVFPFKFTFYDIGMYNDSGDLGRLMNGKEKDTVIGALATMPSSLKCTEGVESATINGEYVCHYLNNCPNCSFSCDDDNNCEFDDCGDECTLECPNCIFDGDSTNFAFRSVSINNMFPNTRSRGANWDAERSAKAEETLKEIEKSTEEIYATPEYSYVLTPLNMKKIREYNDAAGSYTNSVTPINTANGDDALHCETISFNGRAYNVKCKSSFLDIIENDRFRNQYVQYDSIVRNDEWTLWEENECGENCGPSWK